MGVQQPGKTPGPSTQQIERQLQMVVNDALKVLDASTPVNPANQSEVDSLRSLIWSELTGLESEFGREGGPRADRVDRFFQHLISIGDHIGQIEALGTALLGGEPPPTQPAPGSPVAQLHQIHRSLAALRKQWQQTAAASSTSHPAGTARPASQAQPTSTTPPPANGHARPATTVKAAPPVTGSRKPNDAAASRERRPAATRRKPQQPERKAGGVERILKDLGFKNFSPTEPVGETEPPLPRAVVTYVSVVVIVVLVGIAVIYWGLTLGPKPGTTGTVLNATQTLTIPTASGSPSPTPTFNPAPPQLSVQGNNLQVPCASSQQTTGFIVENAGGQTLSWSSQVESVGGSAPVSLSPSHGNLTGGAGTNTEVVTVTASVNTSVSGTITITSNGGTQVIQYRVIAC